VTIKGGDPTAAAALGVLKKQEAGAGSAPDAPTLTVAQLSSTSFRATIDGDAGVTNELRYAAGAGADWSDGGSRSGDGTIDVADLTAGQVYLVQAFSNDGGYYSEPSVMSLIVLSDTSNPATGSIALPLDLLETTIANSAEFQAWVEAANATAAKTRIYQTAVERDGWTRPYAFITDGDSWRANKQGDPNCFVRSGSLVLGFETDVGSDDVETAARILRNKAGTVLDEMMALAGFGGYLAITDIEKLEGVVESWSEAEDGAGTKEHYLIYEVEVLWQ